MMLHTSRPASARLVAQRAGTLALCLMALSGCTTVKGWFGGKDDKPNKPMALADIQPSVEVSRLWSEGVGKGEGRLGLAQGPVVADGRVYAAAVKGGVRAVDLQTGKPVWRYESKLRLSGGPGVGDGLVVVGGLDGEVIALDAATGAEKWKAQVTNEVITAPAVGLGLVFVRSNDGRLTALDQATGERRWFWSHEVPTLSVRGNGAPVLGPGYVLVGNDDGTVSALSANDGRPLWDIPVAQPEGRTELDRMADVDGSPVLEGPILYASSFKNRTVAIDAPAGRPIWSSEHGGAGRVALGGDHVVVTTPGGPVFGLDKASGATLWQQPGLARRNVTAPAVQGEYAVVGDYDGYVHWLKLDDGEFAARARAGRDPLRATPVVADGVLLVQNVDGAITAFRLGK